MVLFLPFIIYFLDTQRSFQYLKKSNTGMPQSARALIAYGPYEACYLVEHRKSRLQGVETVLCKDGHTVEFEEIEDWNMVEIWVNGQCVFKCDIRDLDYGSDGDLDPLCKKALEAVREAY